MPVVSVAGASVITGLYTGPVPICMPLLSLSMPLSAKLTTGVASGVAEGSTGSRT